MNDIEKAKEILNQYNQCHVASLFDKIDKAKQEELAKQVLNIDFHKIVELYDNTKKEIEIKDKEIKPIEYLDKEKMSKEEKEKLQLERLQQTVKLAYNNVSFYKEKFDEAGITPEDIKTLKDIEKILGFKPFSRHVG